MIGILCIVGLPVGFAIAVGSNYGFRLLPTVAAAVIGEIAGWLLFLLYNEWKVARFLAHKEGGAVLSMGPVDWSTRVQAMLVIACLGVAVGLVVVVAHRTYLWIRSP